MFNTAADPGGHTGFRFWLLATTWTELSVLVLVAINMSATAISREREDGTLDLLLTTPITQAAYLGGKLRGLVMYLMPLVAVPLGTVALAGLYVLAGGFGREGGVVLLNVAPTGAATGAGTVDVPVVLPEIAVLAPLVTLPFVAFVVMVGLQWSLKTKGTIASVVSTFAVVGVIAGLVGLCGWQAGMTIALIGPAIAAMNPLTLLLAAVDPATALAESLNPRQGQLGLAGARVSLAVGAVAAAAVYVMVVYGMRASMVKTFDMTTRKLAGTG